MAQQGVDQGCPVCRANASEGTMWRRIGDLGLEILSVHESFERSQQRLEQLYGDVLRLHKERVKCECAMDQEIAFEVKLLLKEIFRLQRAFPNKSKEA